MTFAQLKAETFRRLSESQSSPVFWTEDDIETALNEGYAELSDASGWDERSIFVDLLNDRPWYDLRDVIGTSLLAIGPTFNDTTNRWLTPTGVPELDARDRRWEANEGQPQRVMTQGLWWMGFWPRVQSDAGTVTQYYTALPDALSDDEDVPGFPSTFHMGIVDYALADLWIQDGETRAALAAWDAYLKTEAKLTAWVDARASVPRMDGYGAVTR